MSLADVSNTLWKERHLLEMLLFKLETQQILLASGRSRWLTLAATEVERVVDELRHVELSRAIDVDAIANELGLDPGCSLLELSEAVPPPWDGVFRQHRDAFMVIAEEIKVMGGTNRDLLRRGEEAMRVVLEGIHGVPYTTDTYTPQGMVTTRPSALVLDEVM
jgi:FlgN protein